MVTHMIETIHFYFQIDEEYYRINGFNPFRLTVYLEQIDFYDPACPGCSTAEIIYSSEYRSINLINLFSVAFDLLSRRKKVKNFYSNA